jgi:hypothetical protein
MPTAKQRAQIAHIVGMVVWFTNIFFGNKFGLTVDQFTLINFTAAAIMIYGVYEFQWGVRREAKAAPTPESYRLQSDL